MTKISAKIKTIRTKLNMSQDRFASKLGISGKTVSAYETGKCSPPLRIIEKMADIYDASFSVTKDARILLLADRLNYLKEVLNDIETNYLS